MLKPVICSYEFYISIELTSGSWAVTDCCINMVSDLIKRISDLIFKMISNFNLLED